MRNGLLGSVAALAASAGLAFGQGPARPAVSDPPEAITPIHLPSGAGAGMATASDPLPAAPIGYPTGPAGHGPTGPAPYGPTDLFGAPPTGYGDGFGGPGPAGNAYAQRPYAQFDYLLYFVQNMTSKYPLISAGTTISNGTTPNNGTTLLFGADNFEFNPFSGARVIFGLPLRCDPRWGFEMGFTILEHRLDEFHQESGDQVLSRPIIEANSDAPGALIIASPGFASGAVQAAAETQFWTLEANITRSLWCGPTVRLRGLAGFRYADLNEGIFINQQSTFLPGVTSFFYGQQVTPFQTEIFDQFQGRNQFIGAQVGLHGECCHGPWRLSGYQKFGIGNNHQTLQIDGRSTLRLAPNSGQDTVPGGLLAVSSNIGRHKNDEFSVLYEGTFQIGYKVTPRMEFTIGYNYFILGTVSRPGDQIDPVVNSTFVPTSVTYGGVAGPNRPAVLFPQSSFWVQGVNFGLNISF